MSRPLRALRWHRCIKTWMFFNPDKVWNYSTHTRCSFQSNPCLLAPDTTDHSSSGSKSLQVCNWTFAPDGVDPKSPPLTSKLLREQVSPWRNWLASKQASKRKSSSSTKNQQTRTNTACSDKIYPPSDFSFGKESKSLLDVKGFYKMAKGCFRGFWRLLEAQSYPNSP